MPPGKRNRKKRKPSVNAADPALLGPLRAMHWSIRIAEGKARMLDVWLPDDEGSVEYIRRKAVRLGPPSRSARYGNVWFYGYTVAVTKWGWSSADHRFCFWSDRTHRFAARWAHRVEGRNEQTLRHVTDMLGVVTRTNDLFEPPPDRRRPPRPLRAAPPRPDMAAEMASVSRMLNLLAGEMRNPTAEHGWDAASEPY